MGQAKQRGSRDERAAQALLKIEAIKPESIICNNCQAEIADVQVMDTRGMVGIDAAFAGVCECGHSTWAMTGDRNAVAKAMLVLDETTGGQSLIGSMPIKAK